MFTHIAQLGKSIVTGDGRYSWFFLVPASQCEAQVGALFSLIVFNVHAVLFMFNDKKLNLVYSSWKRFIFLSFNNKPFDGFKCLCL
jgi:hypothetical protein